MAQEEGDSSFLGPSYEYWKNIKQPGQMGMSPAFTLDALSADVTGLLSYVEVLVTGSGNASKTGKPLGNKFFLKTLFNMSGAPWVHPLWVSLGLPGFMLY